MISYYDKILVGIAGCVLGGILLGVLTPIPFESGLFLGAITASVFVYDAMFRNPPLQTTDPRVAAAVIVWHAALFVLAIGAVVE
ncbi:hypothetical protein [Natronolimnohabitans innermongolicus]|uniref:Uncharacterized protein n=1 Tax=Natronolimnohabitans innermongolicus JCM 12255 TaxID=1227499 RepID=L9XAG2_9EURY|nr:hypothetical protein C493_06862 [Natronolimnohabitans innermongolicus JCM 12255]